MPFLNCFNELFASKSPSGVPYLTKPIPDLKNQAYNDHWNIQRTITNRKEVFSRIIKREEMINIDTLEYNLIRTYNIKQEIKNMTEDLEDFYKRTAIKNQLKIGVTIF